ncbi:xanthine dehydrogenase accessory factor [Streptomyces canus]|uniref:Xanthine dehydrogenase accessory factor n=1 Tax=Streptomyces canus TaxID=58343 RepID=A0AAW8F3Y8_9ACTN|nr:XdhC/CoxI family protein [Streptomyces canus]MDQ0904877.1 xanthine dehydrogenase accessory factor [Streptomyces canus]
MLDIAEDLYRWISEDRDFAVATVTAVSGSAPRAPGAALAVATDGTVVGSVSGGCVEGAVYDLCQQALHDGESVLEHFGYSDEDAFAVGLTCGGSIDVLVTPIRRTDAARTVLASAAAVAALGKAAAVARVARGPAELRGRGLLVLPDGSHQGGFGDHPDLQASAVAAARTALTTGRTGTVVVPTDGSYYGAPLTLLVEVRVPAPRMIVFGATDFAAALVAAGKLLGYHVTVCDARPVFSTAARFPAADEVVTDWPQRYLANTHTDERTVLCVLTHEAKFDIPLLQLALRLPVAYVGAMGSRSTHADRQRRLYEAGLSDHELARLHSPIGLDLGARTPEETAVSIVAEIVALRHGGSGASLRVSDTPIHKELTMYHPADAAT